MSTFAWSNVASEFAGRPDAVPDGAGAGKAGVGADGDKAGVGADGDADGDVGGVDTAVRGPATPDPQADRTTANAATPAPVANLVIFVIFEPTPLCSRLPSSKLKSLTETPSVAAPTPAMTRTATTTLSNQVDIDHLMSE